jgi:hypothetical protein
VSKKPRCFHTARKHPLNLTGRDALLARAHEIENLKPKVQRKMGVLKDSSLPDGELAFALIASMKAKASGLAFHLANALRIRVPAMRAYRAVRPKLALDICKGSGFVIEAGIVKSGFGHGGISYGLTSSI